MSLKHTLIGKNVLVTGGAGFIGSHLVDRIIKEKPAKIVVATNFFLGKPENLSDAMRTFPGLVMCRCDVADYDDIEEMLREHAIDVVFNAAVIPLPTSLVRPEWTIHKNVEMTLNVCKLLRLGLFKTLVQFSSSEAYGSAKVVPMNEEHVLDPETPYAASKAATDLIALSYHHTFGLDVCVVRPFNQYGPRQNAKKYAGIIPLTVGRMMRGEDVILFGDGLQTRDFLYVTDTVDGIIEVYKEQATRGKILNLASGKEVSMFDVVGAIGSVLGYTKPFVYKPSRPGDVRRHLADISAIKNLTGWQPRVSFEEGIRETTLWYKAYFEQELARR